MIPTVVYGPDSQPVQENSCAVSRAPVGFVVGSGLDFSQETAALLTRRLSAASLIIAVVLAAAFLGNLIAGTATLWWLRAIVLMVAIGSALFLRLRSQHTLQQLRTVEMLLFGSTVVQLSSMLLTRSSEFARLGDATSLVATHQQFLAAWCILVFIYGTLMPNTWRRGAMVMIPAALLPYLLMAIHRFLVPSVAELLAVNRANSPLPMPLIAALIATFAAHVINATRREAFKVRQFGQYRLLERLGAGGMGEVYKAEHLLLKRPCAIKLIKSASGSDATATDATAIARFEQEVKMTAKLTHWNTVEIYDYGRTEDGTFYYVIELLPGMTLEDLVERFGPLSSGRMIYLVGQICGALQEAHTAGLIHRDIKPANIFASQRGGGYDVAKLLDFGLVKTAVDNDPSAAALGSRGAFSGTPLYMSPEQALAYEEVDGRADIYSLGAVGYYLLTGKPPFSGSSVRELLAAHRRSEVVPPSQFNPAVSTDLDQVLLKCMAKQPSERFPDARALQQALEACGAARDWGPQQAAAWWQVNVPPDAEPTAKSPAPDVTAEYVAESARND